MEEKKALMDSIKERIDEIFSHSEEISELHFDTKLLNGTRFQFNYNVDEFEKTNRDGIRRYRISTLNAVLDIIGAALSIVLLIMASVSSLTGAATSDAFLILTFTFFLVFFTESAVYHLFKENHARTVSALFIIRHGLLTLSLAAMTSALALKGSGSTLCCLLSLFAVALSVFLSFLGTKLSTKLSALSHVLFPVLILVFIPFSYQSLSLSLMLLLSSLLSVLSPRAKNSAARASGSNGIFLIMSLFLFYLTQGAL